MTESIGTKIYSLLKDAVSISLYEAETATYPYVAYEYTAEPVLSKDGVEGYSADVLFHAVSDDFSEAQADSESIQEALQSGMQSDEFSVALMSSEPTCEDGVWIIELSYTIKQYK